MASSGDDGEDDITNDEESTEDEGGFSYSEKINEDLLQYRQ